MSDHSIPGGGRGVSFRTRRIMTHAINCVAAVALWLRFFSAPGALVYALETIDYWPFEDSEWSWLAKLSMAVFLIVHIGPYVAFAISRIFWVAAGLFDGFGRALEHHPQKRSLPGWPRRLAIVHLIMLACVGVLGGYLLISSGTVQSGVTQALRWWKNTALSWVQDELTRPTDPPPERSPPPPQSGPTPEPDRPPPTKLPREWYTPSTRQADYLPPRLKAPKSVKVASGSKTKKLKLAPYPSSDTAMTYAPPFLVPCIFIALVQPNAMPRECKGEWPSRSGSSIGW